MNIQHDALESQLAQSRATHIVNYSKQAPYVDRIMMQSNDLGDINIIVRHTNFVDIPQPKNIAKVIRARGLGPVA